MELLLQREPTKGRNTLGTLEVNGVMKWHTLEDVVREIPGVPVREWKIAASTAIPSGRYLVHKTFSPRFGREMYLVDGVEGFQGIRIHPINDHDDTEGCIGLGMNRFQMDSDPELEIGHSKLACAEFEKTLDRATGHGETIHITIRNS